MQEFENCGVLAEVAIRAGLMPGDVFGWGEQVGSKVVLDPIVLRSGLQYLTMLRQEVRDTAFMHFGFSPKIETLYEVARAYEWFDSAKCRGREYAECVDAYEGCPSFLLLMDNSAANSVEKLRVDGMSYRVGVPDLCKLSVPDEKFRQFLQNKAGALVNRAIGSGLLDGDRAEVDGAEVPNAPTAQVNITLVGAAAEAESGGVSASVESPLAEVPAPFELSVDATEGRMDGCDAVAAEEMRSVWASDRGPAVAVEVGERKVRIAGSRVHGETVMYPGFGYEVDRYGLVAVGYEPMPAIPMDSLVLTVGNDKIAVNVTQAGDGDSVVVYYHSGGGLVALGAKVLRMVFTRGFESEHAFVAPCEWRGLLTCGESVVCVGGGGDKGRCVGTAKAFITGSLVVGPTVGTQCVIVDTAKEKAAWKWYLRCVGADMVVCTVAEFAGQVCDHVWYVRTGMRDDLFGLRTDEQARMLVSRAARAFVLVCDDVVLTDPVSQRVAEAVRVVNDGIRYDGVSSGVVEAYDRQFGAMDGGPPPFSD